jgi:zinc and cadmium transporter
MWIYSILSVILVSLISLIWLLTFPLKPNILKRIVFYMVSFSVWALFGDVFIHLLPEITERIWFNMQVSLWIIGWIIFSFVIEKFVHWRHCHVQTSKTHPHPFVIMNLVWESIHNLVDWLIIWASYLLWLEVWIATTIAILLHEIPHEIWNFGILIYGWFSRNKAISYNFITSFAAIFWTLLVLVFQDHKWMIDFLVPIAAWNFIYIAWTDLIPELHKETEIKKSITQLCSFLWGIVFMLILLKI